MRRTSNAADIPSLRIGEVSKATGLSASTIRWYEKLGLILPQRESSGYRTYTQDDVAWLMQLKEYFAATNDSPRCLAELLAWLPLRQLRMQMLDIQCTCKPGGGVCWSVGGSPLQVRICRDCPAYANKAVALEPRKFFEARWRPAALPSKLPKD